MDSATPFSKQKQAMMAIFSDITDPANELSPQQVRQTLRRISQDRDTAEIKENMKEIWKSITDPANELSPQEMLRWWRGSVTIRTGAKSGCASSQPPDPNALVLNTGMKDLTRFSLRPPAQETSDQPTSTFGLIQVALPYQELSPLADLTSNVTRPMPQWRPIPRESAIDTAHNLFSEPKASLSPATDGVPPALFDADSLLRDGYNEWMPRYTRDSDYSMSSEESHTDDSAAEVEQDESLGLREHSPRDLELCLRPVCYSMDFPSLDEDHQAEDMAPDMGEDEDPRPREKISTNEGLCLMPGSNVFGLRGADGRIQGW